MLVPHATDTVAGLTQDRAAPAGGALKRGRGCLFAGFPIFAASVALAVEAADGAISLPSGRSAQLQELIQETSGEAFIARFRFVAPWIAGGTEYASVYADMEYLCQSFAMVRLAELGVKPSQVVISLSEAKSDFGVAAPEITQFFETFTLSDGLCIWEAF